MFQFTISEMLDQALAMPIHVQLWLAWLLLVTVVTPLFLLSHRQARVLLYWQVGNALFGLTLWSAVGLVRLLSLSHLLFWIPAVVYLLRHRLQEKRTWFGTWVDIAIASMSVSLVIDVVELARYALGERGLIGA